MAGLAGGWVALWPGGSVAIKQIVTAKKLIYRANCCVIISILCNRAHTIGVMKIELPHSQSPIKENHLKNISLSIKNLLIVSF